MGFASDNRLFLTVGKSSMKKSPLMVFSDNFLTLENLPFLKSPLDKSPMLGFHLQKDGLEIYHLFEERWLILADISYCQGAIDVWIDNRFLKAIECIPTQDESICCFIGNLKVLEEMIVPKVFLKRPNLPFVILLDKDLDSQPFLVEKGKSAKKFDTLEFETVKEHLLIRGWQESEPTFPTIMYYHLKK